jgi:hypothetical protein
MRFQTLPPGIITAYTSWTLKELPPGIITAYTSWTLKELPPGIITAYTSWTLKEQPPEIGSYTSYILNGHRISIITSHASRPLKRNIL